MANSAPKISKYAVAFVVTGGIIWVVAAILYGAQIVSCFSCASVVLAPGVGATAYPSSAIHNLAWDDLYANLYVGAIGLLAIAIGLKALRRGQKWGWYSVLIFVLTGVLTSFLDYLSWGRWYTFLFLGLPSLLGLVLSANIIFSRKSKSLSSTNQSNKTETIDHD
jgi:hypothetical protein